MLKDTMYVLNYFAISWIVISFLWFFFSLVYRVKIKIYNLIIWSILTILAFSIFGFNYEPSEFADLFRHYELLDKMRTGEATYYYSHEFITYFIFSFVARTDYNQLLPFIVTIIRYSIFFIMVYLFVKKFEINNYYLRLFIFFNLAFLPLIESISGIRYYFAITVLASAFIFEFFFQKKWRYKLYGLISLFIHTSSIMFLGLKFISNQFPKLIKVIKIILLFWSLFYLPIANILQTIGLGITQTAGNLLITYIEEERGISLNLVVARLVMILIVFFMYWMLKRKDYEMYKLNIKYYNFLELILYFAVGSILIEVIFQRTAFFISLISMPLFFNFFKSEKISKFYKNILIILIIFLSCGMYLNQFYGIMVGYF